VVAVDERQVVVAGGLQRLEDLGVEDEVALDEGDVALEVEYVEGQRQRDDVVGRGVARVVDEAD